MECRDRFFQFLREDTVRASPIETEKTHQLLDLADIISLRTLLEADRNVRKIFFTTDNSRYWRDIRVLDLNTGDERMLFRDARIGDLVVNPADKALWGVRHNRGISTLIRMPDPYIYRYEILEMAYGNDLFDLDISPDGKTMLGVLLEINGRQKLITMNIDSLMAGNRSHEVVYEFENNSPANFVS